MDNHKLTEPWPSVHDVRFSTDEVIKVVGINEGTLQNWLARGRLNLTQQNPGRGKPRQYTAYEVARIRFIKKLVDVGFPLAPAFKITAALKKLWDLGPGSHEAYAGEIQLASWILIVAADVWKAREGTAKFPLDYSRIVADEFVAIWAVEILVTPRPARLWDAIKFFDCDAVIVINMGSLLAQTTSMLFDCIVERGG